MKIKSLLLFFCILSVSFLYSLEHITQEQRKDLEAFFHHFIIREGFAFSLFGDKPLSIGGFWEIEDAHFGQDILDPIGFTLDACGPKNIQTKKGWQVWNELKDFFPETHFILFESKLTFVKNYRIIGIINVKAFHEVFAQYEQDFKKVLGPNVTAEKLIKKLQEEKTNFYATLKDNDGLLGTLLGYGRKNAWLFHRRNEIDDRFWIPHVFSLKKREKKTSEKFQSLFQEISWLKSVMEFFPKKENVLPDINRLGLHIPHFIANYQDEETLKLEEKFLQQCRAIVKRYDQGNFFEITCKQFQQQ